jgi:predicted Holliday junction resolvase-like endonuclease
LDRWQKYVKDKLSELKRERAHDLDAARDQYNRALDRREQAVAKEKEELQAKANAERDAAVDRERAVADQRVRLGPQP